MGANTAIFSVVDSVLLRPLNYREPQQLYIVREIVPQLAKFAPTLGANLPDFRIWQKQVHSFADVAIAEYTTAGLTGAGEPEIVRGVRASADIFRSSAASLRSAERFYPRRTIPVAVPWSSLPPPSGAHASMAIRRRLAQRWCSTASPIKSWVSFLPHFRCKQHGSPRLFQSLERSKIL